MAHVNNIQPIILEDISTKSISKNLDEDRFVMAMKDMVGINSRNKFPNDFDTWTVKQQYDWLNQNIEKFFPNMPQSLQSIIPAAFCQIDYYDRSPEKLPEWMDMDKYRKGQKFVQKHYFALVVSKILGMIYAFSFDDGLTTSILGEHHHTPYLSFQRYFPHIKYCIYLIN